MLEDVEIPVIMSIRAPVTFAGKETDIGIIADEFTAKASTDIMHTSLYLHIPINDQEDPEVRLLIGMVELEEIIEKVQAECKLCTHTEEDEKRRNEMWVRTITRLVKQHKSTCEDENCGVQTLAMANLIEHILKRKLTPEEEEVFL